MESTKSKKQKITEQQLEVILNAFKQFQQTDDGKIIVKDVLNSFERLQFQKKNQVFYQMFQDLNLQYKQITFEQLIQKFKEVLGSKETQDGVQKIFQIFKDNKQGPITFDHLKRYSQSIGLNPLKDELEDIISKASDNEKELKYNQFEEIFYKK